MLIELSLIQMKNSLLDRTKQLAIYISFLQIILQMKIYISNVYQLSIWSLSHIEHLVFKKFMQYFTQYIKGMNIICLLNDAIKNIKDA